MNTLTVTSPQQLRAPSLQALEALEFIQERILEFPQIELATEHILHGGMYARTIRLGPGTVTVGSLIKLPTVLIINGSCSVLQEGGWVRLDGFNVIAGAAGRKMLRVTHGSVELTMIVPTQAKTIEQAEDEVFAEADQLMSRRDSSRDTVTITGA